MLLALALVDAVVVVVAAETRKNRKHQPKSSREAKSAVKNVSKY